MRTFPRAARQVQRPRSQAGQAAIEFAIGIVPFLLLVLGIFEFSRINMIMTTLDDSARCGARWAVTAPADTNGIVAAAQHAALYTRTDPPSVTVTFPGGSTTSGNPVKVTVNYQLKLLDGMIAAAIGTPTIALTSVSQMVIE